MRTSVRAVSKYPHKFPLSGHAGNSVMDKKITRRAVLGTIIGSLIAGPFVVRALRSPKKIELSSYSEIAIRDGDYGGDVTPDQIERAFNFLIGVRSEWLKFRGVSGLVKVSAEANENGVVQQLHDPIIGFLDLRLSNPQEVATNVHLQPFPQKARLSFSDDKTGEKRWEAFFDHSSGEYRFEGDSKDDTDVPRTIMQILTLLSLEIFPDLPNNTLKQSSELWEIHGKDDHWSFSPSKVLTGDKAFMPEFVVENRLLKKYIGKKFEKQPYSVFLLDDYVSKNDFQYPSKQIYYFEGASLPRQVKISIEFLELSSVFLD